MTVQSGRRAGGESAGTIVAAHVDLTAAAEEGHGEVFGGGFDVLLVAGDGGEAEARVAGLLTCELGVG